jgi:hypothetical protein
MIDERALLHCCVLTALPYLLQSLSPAELQKGMPILDVASQVI